MLVYFYKTTQCNIPEICHFQVQNYEQSATRYYQIKYIMDTEINLKNIYLFILQVVYTFTAKISMP
jgi:hypothetical protein